MAVKRNNNVSSTISRLDRRVHTVESRAVSLAGASGVTTTTPSDEDPAGAPGALGATPPYRYRPVTKAYIYGDKVTGNNSRLELYFSENPEIVAQDTLRLQGLHGTSTDNFELSPKTFKVFATDTPPWTDDVRSRQPWRNTPTVGNNGETVEYTVWFNPVVEVPTTYPSNAGRELITTRRIDTMSVTGSTVTVNLNATHLFEVGDVIYIDSISTHTVLFGVDGLFKVSEVVSSTAIKYELDSPVSVPFSLSSAQVGTKYVYPVAQRFVEEGTIWTDTSVEPNRVYVWKEYRWYDTADPIGTVTAQQDGIAPSPVTDLEGESSLPAGTTSPVISLTWTPPTTRSNGSTISGFLDGYDIWYKRSTEILWKKEFIKDGGGGISSHEIKDAILLQNVTYNIRVYAVDIMGQYSTEATVNVVTAKYSEALNAPSVPVATSKLGTITVTWDGLDSAGNLPVPGIIYIEFHESTTSGFTPSSSTLVETLPITNSGNYIVLTERTMNTENPSLAPTYYYKTQFVRQVSPTELETSAASAESVGQKVVGVTGPDVVAGSVTTNKLEAGFVTASLVRGDVIRAGTSSTSPRVELRSTGIAAFNGISGDPATFTVSSSDGSVSITGGTLTAPAITGGILQTSASASTGVKINSSGISAYNSGNPTPTFSVDSSNGAVTIRGGSLTITSGADLQGYATDGELGAVSTVADTAITRIESGQITVTKAKAVGAINEGVEAGNTTTINGGSIKTGSINADRIEANTITATQISSAYIYAGTINANNITTGTLTGRVVRTSGSASDQRLSLNTDGRIVFFRAGNAGTPDAEIQGGSEGADVLSIRVPSGSTTGINVAPGGLTITGGGSLTAGGNVFAGDSIGAFNLRTTSVRYVTTLSNQSGYTQLGAIVPSDERIKQNIQTTDLGLDFVNEINPVQFDFINKEIDIDNGPQFGVIAQQLKSTLQAHGVPEENGMVYKSFNSGDEEDYLYLVNRDQLIAPLIKAIQELSQKNEDLQARIATLEGTT